MGNIVGRYRGENLYSFRFVATHQQVNKFEAGPRELRPELYMLVDSSTAREQSVGQGAARSRVKLPATSTRSIAASKVVAALARTTRSLHKRVHLEREYSIQVVEELVSEQDIANRASVSRRLVGANVIREKHIPMKINFNPLLSGFTGGSIPRITNKDQSHLHKQAWFERQMRTNPSGNLEWFRQAEGLFAQPKLLSEMLKRGLPTGPVRSLSLHYIGPAAQVGQVSLVVFKFYKMHSAGVGITAISLLHLSYAPLVCAAFSVVEFQTSSSSPGVKLTAQGITFFLVTFAALLISTSMPSGASIVAMSIYAAKQAAYATVLVSLPNFIIMNVPEARYKKTDESLFIQTRDFLAYIVAPLALGILMYFVFGAHLSFALYVGVGFGICATMFGTVHKSLLSLWTSGILKSLDKAEAKLELARRAMSKGSFDKAIEWVEQARAEGLYDVGLEIELHELMGECQYHGFINTTRSFIDGNTYFGQVATIRRYLYGKGVEKNYAKAAQKIYKLIEEIGEAMQHITNNTHRNLLQSQLEHSYHMLGWMHLDGGHGIEKDVPKAITNLLHVPPTSKFYEEARYYLGHAEYELGNISKAVGFLEEAGVDGSASLCILYASGKFIAKSNEVIIHFCEKSASKDPNSAVTLAEILLPVEITPEKLKVLTTCLAQHKYTEIQAYLVLHLFISGDVNQACTHSKILTENPNAFPTLRPDTDISDYMRSKIFELQKVYCTGEALYKAQNAEYYDSGAITSFSNIPTTLKYLCKLGHHKTIITLEYAKLEKPFTMNTFKDVVRSIAYSHTNSMPSPMGNLAKAIINFVGMDGLKDYTEAASQIDKFSQISLQKGIERGYSAAQVRYMQGVMALEGGHGMEQNVDFAIKCLFTLPAAFHPYPRPLDNSDPNKKYTMKDWTSLLESLRGETDGWYTYLCNPLVSILSAFKSLKNLDQAIAICSRSSDVESMPQYPKISKDDKALPERAAHLTKVLEEYTECREAMFLHAFNLIRLTYVEDACRRLELAGALPECFQGSSDYNFMSKIAALNSRYCAAVAGVTTNV